ncbi:hypothetical protein KCP77_11095 [Salmonella enterica subsp. enterica]|nr:hypothetical protein KCP77_11095 [Salmonella enterica subsp. enterica]
MTAAVLAQTKRFADRGADACEHEYIILLRIMGEMQAGAYTNRLNRQTVGLPTASSWLPACNA